MQTSELLLDAYGRIRQIVRRATDGLDAEGLAYRPDPEANSIAWLIWHLTRIQDDHVSELAGREQTWFDGPWAERLGLAPATADTGFGHTSEQVAAVRPDGPEPLVGYHEAVADRTVEYLSSITADDLDRIIDRSWDPPVTVGVRLVSVIGDNMQHVGQASYVRGLLERSRQR